MILPAVILSILLISGLEGAKKPSESEKIAKLEAEIAELRQTQSNTIDSMNMILEDVQNKLWDLHYRVKKLEGRSNDEKASNVSIQAQLNALDSRVAELERPENPEDEAH